MTVDIEALVQWAMALTALVSFLGLIAKPFKKVMVGNKQAMRALEEAVKELSWELKESQKDRQAIHRTLDVHGERLSRVEDDVIRLDTYCETNRGHKE